MSDAGPRKPIKRPSYSEATADRYHSLKRIAYTRRSGRPLSGKPMFERRGEPRNSCSLNAIALFNDLRRDCLVVNISAHGARLKFRGFIGLPDKFDLYIPEEEITARAVVQWRHENEVGVALERRPVEIKSDTAFLLDRIAQLEAEVRELRAHTMARAVPSL